MGELDDYTPEQIEEARRVILGRRETKRRYGREHAVEIAEKRSRYNQEHLERRAEYDRRRYQEDRDVRLESQKRYDQEHRDERREYNLGRKDEVREQYRQYCREHPEIHIAAWHRRRAAIAGSDGHFTAEEFRILCEVSEYMCFYCGQKLPLTPDHVVPLSRGGSNSVDNILPACFSCNAQKGAKTLEEYVEYLRQEVGDKFEWGKLLEKVLS